MVMAHWLLQANRTRWRIADFFADGHHETTWPIRRHRTAVTEGDQVALWLSGKDGGVAALGIITAEPVQGRVPDPQYWSPKPPDKDGWLLPVRFDQIFVGTPIARATLAADPRFATSLIMRMSGGGNPFPVKPLEWEAIEEHIPPHGPVAATVRGAAAVVAAGATAVREAFRSAITRS